MSDTVVLQGRKHSVLVDLVPGALARDALLVVAAACLVGVLAQVSVHLSFTPVPITGQTLGVLLAGAALGSRRGAAAMAFYAVAGVAGIPWFAGHAHGYVGASFGYVVGFVLCAGLCGYLAERGADRSIAKSIPAMVAGELVIYLCGVTWLALSLHLGIARALALGLVPFVVGDALKAALAAVVLPGAWKVVGGDRGARLR
ncbi:MAG: biotin transporter BioY [Actinomycetota bacterium]|nr:biotin transporter BioY [Actinomycetota bacterium]